MSSGLMRSMASSLVMSFSFAMSTAMRNAAAGVRFPVRVCNMYSVPSSTVNSMSCMSR